MKKIVLCIFSTLILISCNSVGTKKNADENTDSGITEESVFSENNEESIKHVVLNLFDGVRESNKDKIVTALAVDAEFVSAKEEDGALVEKITKGTDFAEKAGAEHEKIWDERLSDIQTEISGNTAILSANYEFYLGEEFSHRGEMKINLNKTDGIWLIQKVWYTVVK